MVRVENDTTFARSHRSASANPKITAASHRIRVPSLENTEFIEPDVSIRISVSPGSAGMLARLRFSACSSAQAQRSDGAAR